MDTIDLCELWARLAAKPGDPVIAEEARQHLVQFLSHVDDCDQCQAVSAGITEPDLVFAALAADAEPLPEAELEQLEAGHTAFGQGTQAIEGAVVQWLLPMLPPALKPPPVKPLELFLATDAVNLLARAVSADSPDPFVEMTVEGVLAADELVSERDEITTAIAEHARVKQELADALLTWQFKAAASYPRLYRGLVSVAFGDSVLLTRVPSKSAEELAKHWQTMAKGHVTVPRAVEEAIPAELLEYVEAAGTMLSQELPAFQEVGATLRSTGEKELGTFLVRQTEEGEKEKAEFAELLKRIEMQMKDFAAKDSQQVKGLQVKRLLVKGLQVKGTVSGPVFKRKLYANRVFSKPVNVQSRGGFSVAKVVVRNAERRKRLYQSISKYPSAPSNEMTWLKMFAERGVRRADIELKCFKNVSFGGKFLGGA